jgi:hypothetical protein
VPISYEVNNPAGIKRLCLLRYEKQAFHIVFEQPLRGCLVPISYEVVPMKYEIYIKRYSIKKYISYLKILNCYVIL